MRIVQYSEIEVVITMHDERFADGMADVRSTAENNNNNGFINYFHLSRFHLQKPKRSTHQR